MATLPEESTDPELNNAISGAAAAAGNRSLAKVAESYLRNAIVRKILKPGDIIDFNAIEKAMRMSRTPIRESIRRLQSAGLVEITSSGQARVSILCKARIKAFYAVRLGLECAAAELASRNITDNEIEILRLNLSMFMEMLDEPTVLPELDGQFHEIIYDSTRNRYLSERLKSLRVVLGLIPRTSFDSKTRIHDLHREHADILYGLERRNPEITREATMTHIRNAMHEPLSEAQAGTGGP